MNFYSNITLFGPSQIEIARELMRKNHAAVVSPTVKGYTVISEEQCDSDDINDSEPLALMLSARFKCPVLVVLNKHDGILLYKLYSDGIFLDEYNSSPDYFNIAHNVLSDVFSSVPVGGNPEVICTVLAKPECIIGVEEVLHQQGNYRCDDCPAQERHRDLTEELGIPEFSIGFSFSSILQDAFLPYLTNQELIYTGYLARARSTDVGQSG